MTQRVVRRRREESKERSTHRRRWILGGIALALVALVLAVRCSNEETPREWTEFDVKVSGLH